MTSVETREPKDVRDVPHDHPSDKKYVLIAVFLGVITAVEITLYYLEDTLGSLVAPSLIFLSSVKFFVVVAFFMHLKFDKPILRWIFALCLFLAIACYIGYLMAMGGIFGIEPKPFHP